MSENKQKEVSQSETQKTEDIKVTPFARMVANYYELMCWIQPEEKEEFAISLCRKSGNGLVDKLNNFVHALTGNLIGALFAPLLVKISMRCAQKLDYTNEIDEMKAEAKKAIIAETFAEMKA